MVTQISSEIPRGHGKTPYSVERRQGRHGTNLRRIELSVAFPMPQRGN